MVTVGSYILLQYVTVLPAFDWHRNLPYQASGRLHSTWICPRSWKLGGFHQMAILRGVSGVNFRWLQRDQMGTTLARDVTVVQKWDAIANTQHGFVRKDRSTANVITEWWWIDNFPIEMAEGYTEYSPGTLPAADVGPGVIQLQGQQGSQAWGQGGPKLIPWTCQLSQHVLL